MDLICIHDALREMAAQFATRNHYKYEFSQKKLLQRSNLQAQQQQQQLQQRNITNSNRIKVNYLGVVRADPIVYMKQYGDSLINSEKLPEYIKHIPTPPGIELAADKQQKDYNNDDVENEILEAIKRKTYEIVDESKSTRGERDLKEDEIRDIMKLTSVNKNNENQQNNINSSSGGKIKSQNYNIQEEEKKKTTTTTRIENLKLSKHQVDYIIDFLSKQIKYELERINELKNMTIY